jgi:hypothetical protein
LIGDGLLNIGEGRLLGLQAREHVCQEGHEQRDIFGNKLGRVHVSEVAHQQSRLRLVRISSASCSGSSKDGEDIAKPEIIVALLRELFLAEAVQHVKFFGQCVNVLIPTRRKLDLNNDLTICSS